MKNLIFNLIFVFCFSQTHLVFAQNSVPKEPPGLTDEEAFLYYQALEAENKIDCENNQKPTTPPDIIYRKPMELYSCVSPSEKERTIMRLGFDPEKVKLRIDPPTTPPAPAPQQNPTPISNGFIDQIIPSSLFDKMPPLSKVLNQLFYLGLLVAIVLAIVMIIRGGVEYMTIDAIYSKESGKNRIKAALGGLLLAFSTILILNTINPSLTSLKLVFPRLQMFSQTNISGGLVSKTRDGTYSNWKESDAENWVEGLTNGVRSTDGRLVVSTYSASGDAITDSNTSQKRGNANNLLREGSVALSPDLIAQYKPKTGSEVFINGISIGFYEDATASSFNGTQFRNTVDIYDENKTLGTKLKNIPSGEWEITFGESRPQISNP